MIEADGRWPAYGHGLGHGIGLATHELPSLGPAAARRAAAVATVFSVEPGIYLEGETGVRIEDLVLLDAGAGRVERLTQFPREVLVVGWAARPRSRMTTGRRHADLVAPATVGSLPA